MGAPETLDEYQDLRLARGLGGLFYGVYPAVVSDLDDPARQGRVKVRLPWAPDADQGYEAWARMATLMAGNDRGSWFIPDVGDEVLVAFAGGDARSPFVLGGLWNGSDAPPETMDSAGRNEIKKLRSRNGVMVTMEDKQGQEKFIVETPGGQSITLKDGPGTVEIVDSNGNSVKLEPAGITVNASAKVTINASVVEISAGMVTVNAGMSRFNGVVQADTVISTSVISATYTPGAGNIW
jgi:uncharacterized protein involved in type VI secretion and phage assembly